MTVIPATQSSPITLADAVSTAANVNSDTLRLGRIPNVGLHVVIANTSASGIYIIQISNDGVNWVDVTLSTGATSVSVSSGTDINDFISLADLGAHSLRFRWEGSGVGTITVDAVAQG